MGQKGLSRFGALAFVMFVSGCGGQHGHPTASKAPSFGPPPQPPAGMAAGLVVPEAGSDGRYATINSGVSREEALWHVRAALNVAALSCAHRPEGRAITQHYNVLLKQRKIALAAAYASESSRFGSAGKGALDTHMTRLYNFFAQPSAQASFCGVAADVAARAVTVQSPELPKFATGALDKLEAPILDYYRSYATYRRDLAAWNARVHDNGTSRRIGRSP